MGKSVDDITNRLNEVLADLGLLVEKLTITRGKSPVVVVDVDLIEGTGAVPGDLLEQASRLVSIEMDTIDPLPTAYTLEVGTPGAERDLRTLRHFQRTLGGLVKVKAEGVGRLSGRLVEVTSGDIVVEAAGKNTRIPLESITSARSRVDFSRTEE